MSPTPSARLRLTPALVLLIVLGALGLLLLPVVALVGVGIGLLLPRAYLGFLVRAEARAADAPEAYQRSTTRSAWPAPTTTSRAAVSVTRGPTWAAATGTRSPSSVTVASFITAPAGSASATRHASRVRSCERCRSTW